MIVEAFLNVIMGINKVLFFAFPNLPPMPEVFVEAFGWFLVYIGNIFGVLVYLLSPPVYVAIIAILLFMTTFEYVYHFAIRFLIFRIFMGFVGR